MCLLLKRFSVIGIMIWRLVTTAVPKKAPDLVYDTYLLALQSHLELWLGILAANLPTIVPLARRIKIIKWNSYFSKYRSGSNGSDETPRSISLKTFSGRRTPRRRDNGDFGLLTDQSIDVESSARGIHKSQHFKVSVDRPENVGMVGREPTTIV